MQTSSSQQHLRGEYANYGEFLYIEGLANMEHRRQKAQHVTQELQEQELQGATFRPEILEKSRSMQSHVHVPVWQRLGRHSRTTSAAKRRAIYQADRERENLTECTFKPKVRPACCTSACSFFRFKPVPDDPKGKASRRMQQACAKKKRYLQPAPWWPGNLCHTTVLLHRATKCSQKVLAQQPSGRWLLYYGRLSLWASRTSSA